MWKVCPNERSNEDAALDCGAVSEVIARVYTLERKLRERTARIAIVGLGYAGLPMAVEIARAGFDVVGYDIDANRVATVNCGRSPVSNVQDADIAAFCTTGQLSATTDASALESTDVAIVCVPTP